VTDPASPLASALACISDAELVAAARAGDMEAFACLAGRHRGMVVAVARRLLGTEDPVADVIQEATVAALISLDRLRSPGQFGAWYAGIALNVARRLLREAPAGPLPEEYPDHEPGPAEQAEAADVARRVRAAVAALAPGQRAAVLAFYWQGRLMSSPRPNSGLPSERSRPGCTRRAARWPRSSHRALNCLASRR
jgi:RNA polymerase sigma-70 factor, ECF subfamily